MIKTFREEYEFLSNMYPCRIQWQGLVYPALENAYQAMKCINELDRHKFTDIEPHAAKKLGKTIPMRPDFDDLKYELMKNLLDVKFSNPELLNKLLNTAPESIVEGNWWHDNYWGACQCSKCKDKLHFNYLGELLQRKRNLSAEYSDTFTMYQGSIYNRNTQSIVERPSILYDKDTYTVIKVGGYNMCRSYLDTVAQTSAEFASNLYLYELSPYMIDFMGMNLACEKLNQALQFTGRLKEILNLD